jgi:serine/threonine protein phosphatase PrpC
MMKRTSRIPGFYKEPVESRRRLLAEAADLDTSEIARVLAAGDVYLLCSDGLTDVLDDRALCAHMIGRDPEDMVDHIIESAIEAGAEDNVTVVVIALGA